MQPLQTLIDDIGKPLPWIVLGLLMQHTVTQFGLSEAAPAGRAPMRAERSQPRSGEHQHLASSQMEV